MADWCAKSRAQNVTKCKWLVGMNLCLLVYAHVLLYVILKIYLIDIDRFFTANGKILNMHMHIVVYVPVHPYIQYSVLWISCSITPCVASWE